MADLNERLQTAVTRIRALLPDHLQQPIWGIVCGSGLGTLSANLQDVHTLDAADIGFARSSVEGHLGKLAFGTLSGVPVVCQLGRLHAYEGHLIPEVVFPIRCFAQLGVKSVIITNASGSLNRDIPAGTIVALKDHVSLPSLTSMNPLIGPNVLPGRARFPPMSNCYDFLLRKAAFKAAKHPNVDIKKGDLREGIYAWVSGPTYETRAEARFLQAAGADLVGMSTVAEVIAAHHIGLRVLVFSLVTNVVIQSPYQDAEAAAEAELAGKPLEEVKEETANHQEVLEMAKEKAKVMSALVQEVIGSVTPQL